MLVTPISAQVAWTLQTPPTSPSLRTEVGMESDGLGALLFGGQYGPSSVAYNELWRFDGTDWTLQVPIGGIAPPPRSRFATAWDSVRQRFVVFGGDGQYTGGPTLGDTWEWDPATSTWTQGAPTSSPTPRIHARMAYDLINLKVLLFGGRGAGSAETWLWDGTDWTQQFPSNVPTGREQTHLATNWANARVMMFGGSTGAGAGVLGDTWEWDGSDWTQLITATIPGGGGIRNGKATYDALRDRVIVHGGLRFTGGFSPSAWEWDGSDWVERLPAVAPGGRTGQGLAFAPALQTTVLFGGYNGGVFGDTWTYQTATVPQVSGYGAGCSGPGGALAYTPLSDPWIGETYLASCSGLGPTSLAIDVIGLASTSLPLVAVLPVAGFGCDLLATLDYTGGPIVPSGGMVQTSFPLPNNPAIAGAVIYEQIAEMEFGVGGWVGLYTSNALAVTIGMR